MDGVKKNKTTNQAVERIIKAIGKRIKDPVI
jgi:hypothetical protein